MEDKTRHVFLGPTLSKQELPELPSNFHIHPPAKCGDVLKIALSENIHSILIIDGYFENTSSIWHKEILYAMGKGIYVLGAASMGAIRAAELDKFGMYGIGEIYRLFTTGVLLDDDEVAICHLGEEFSFKSLSDAMVNIRKTLTIATNEKIITPQTADFLIQNLKNKHYKDRNLFETVQQYLQSSQETNTELQKLSAFLFTKGLINLKKMDALEAINVQLHLPEAPFYSGIQIKETVFFSNLKNKIAIIREQEASNFSHDLFDFIIQVEPLINHIIAQDYYNTIKMDYELQDIIRYYLLSKIAFGENKAELPLLFDSFKDMMITACEQVEMKKVNKVSIILYKPIACLNNLFLLNKNNQIKALKEFLIDFHISTKSLKVIYKKEASYFKLLEKMAVVYFYVKNFIIPLNLHALNTSL